MIACLLFALFFDAPPTPEQVLEIDAQVKRLGHARYAVREAAAKKLVEIGSPAKGRVLAATMGRDPEVARRATVIVESIAEAEVKDLYPMPQIDSFWFDVSRKDYCEHGPMFEQLHPVLRGVGRDSCPWPNYYHATELAVRKWLAEGASRKQLRFVLAAMHYRDSVFLSTKPAVYMGSPLPPAVDWKAYLEAGR